MKDWAVNLIVGLGSAIIGFLGGIITKTYQIKNKQKIKGKNNKQTFEVFGNGNEK